MTGPWILSTTALALLGWTSLESRRQRRAHESERAAAERTRRDQQNELARQQAQLDRWMGFIKRLHESGLSPSGKADPAGTAAAALEAIEELTGAELSVLLQTTAEGTEFVPTAVRGLSLEHTNRLHVQAASSVIGRAAQSRSAVIRLELSEEIVDGFLTAPFAILPLPGSLRPAAVLVLAKPQGGRFAPEALRFADVIAAETGLLLNLFGLEQDLNRAHEETVRALAHAVEAKDAYTHRHSDRTRGLVRALAAELHVPELWIRQIEYGALLHDVGKIGTPEAILRKAGKLSPEEYKVMKEHPALGHRILSGVPFLRPTAAIVLYHQEWYNGNGYPEGLAGEEIPLGARIVALIDAWDAMTSDRPYRQAITKAAAIAELRRQAGTQFDPKLVETFLRVIERLEREGVATTEALAHEAPAGPHG